METGNIILLVILLLILILYPIFAFRKNKKDQEKQQNLISTLKKGDFIITFSGIFGKIEEIVEKELGKFIVIETGEKNKNFITVSENAVYMKVDNNPKVYDSNGKIIEQKKPNTKTETKERISKKVTNNAENQEEKPAKKPTMKKSTARKTTKK